MPSPSRRRTRLAVVFPVLGLPLVARAEIVWGAASAAYQVEGFRAADGRQPSVWDAFDTPGVSAAGVVRDRKPNGLTNVFQGETAADAVQDYARYNETADLYKSLGFGAARLSLSWSRLLSYTPSAQGLPAATRNEAGIQHYRSVLAAYRARGVLTAVTLFHWDLPLALEEYAATQPCGSFWLCHTWMGDVFADYVKLAIGEFADMVDWWITINEPLTVTAHGYADGTHAPGRCSDRSQCWRGNSSTEPYLAAKGLVLAHARAFRAWEGLGRPGRGCGITINADWRVPISDSPEDVSAAERSLEWQAAVFADPIHFGRWPASMVEAAAERLPPWTRAEAELVTGSHDGHFFMNHYTTNFARARAEARRDWLTDQGAEVSGYHFGTGAPIGTPSSNGWLFNYGPGLGQLMTWYHRRYPGVRFVVTENGWGNATSSREAELGVDDRERCSYYRDYLGNLSAAAAEHGMRVDAYFAWSLLDNFEWADGFSVRFGLTYVDYDTQERTPKASAAWFRDHVAPLKELPLDGQAFPPCAEAGFIAISA